MPDIKYPKNSNSDTVFVEDSGQRTRAVKTVQPDGTIDYPKNPNSDSCYVTVDGEKQRALMVADISSAGTVEYPNNPNSTKGYVDINGKKQRVTFTANIAGGGGTPVIDELNVTPSTSAQTITAPSGTDGYSPVNVSAVDASIDANITAGNIKKDVTILGVTGTLESGITPTGTISITTNGTHDVTNYASVDVNVPTTAPARYIEYEVDNGELKPSTTSSALMSFAGVTTVSMLSLAKAYENNTNISGVVDLSSITTIEPLGLYQAFYGTSITEIKLNNADTFSTTSFYGTTGYVGGACESICENCLSLTKADISGFKHVTNNTVDVYSRAFYGCTNLETVSIKVEDATRTTSTQEGCFRWAFAYSGLKTLDLSTFKTVTGGWETFYLACIHCNRLTSATLGIESLITSTNNRIYKMFNAMFQGSTALTDLNIDDLHTIDIVSNNAVASSFAQFVYGCTALKELRFSSLSLISHHSCFNNAFGECDGLHVYFPSFNTTSLGSRYTNQFSACLYNSTNCVLHFPSNVQSIIEALSGYSTTTPFGAISGTVLFDLPATVTLTGADSINYLRNPKYDTATALGWRDSTDTDWNPVYTSGTTDPQVNNTIYSDAACTTPVTTISSIA